MNSTRRYLDWIRIHRSNSGRKSVVRTVSVPRVAVALDDANGDGMSCLVVKFHVLVVT
jgi:hypothetical protein